jgi:hypothetical protein
MGSARAASNTDPESVVCVEAKGTFTSSTVPAPPGTPDQTFTYAVVCHDPSTGNVTDPGFDTKPMKGTFRNSVTLDPTDPVN